MFNKALNFIVIFLIATAVGAQSNADAVRGAFQSAGYEVVSSRSEAGLPVWDLRTEAGMPFSVSMIGRLSEPRVSAVDSLTEIIEGLDGLQPESVRIIFDANRATAIVIPRQFVINGRSYVRFMPSGMQFSYDEAPAYDFRLLVDNLAVRINGAFLSHEQFIDRIVRAVDNPAAYIQSSDPQYLAQQILELRSLLDRLMADVAQVDTESRRRDEGLRAQDEDLQAYDEDLQEEIGRVHQELQSKVDERYALLSEALRDAKREGIIVLRRVVQGGESAVDEINQRIDDVYDETNRKFDETASDHQSLTEEFFRMRRGAVVLATRNIFGTLKEVAPDTIARVVELKTSEPDLPAETVLERVNGELGEEQLPLHKKHVQAIYALFFNDYQ